MKWNERFLAVGGGGYAGSISWPALANAVRNGYAAASTDTGHNGATQPGGSFALNADGTANTQLIEDFAFRSLQQLTIQSRNWSARSTPNGRNILTGTAVRRVVAKD